jgi:hypothetical protein
LILDVDYQKNHYIWNLTAQNTAVDKFTNVVGATTPLPQKFTSTLTGKPEKKLLDIDISFSVPHTITNLKISCQSVNGELYLVLGGDIETVNVSLESRFIE